MSDAGFAFRYPRFSLSAHRPRLLPVLLLVVVLCFAASQNTALAALAKKGGAGTLAQATNPKPDNGDLLLPMPCDATMAFRPVGTQGEGFFWDIQTQFGCDDCDRQDRDYYDRRYGVAVSGPFSPADMPTNWQRQLPKPEVGNYYFYLIGKYEISNFQWNAVMENICPRDGKTLTAEDLKPKTDISWFDALNFAATYTEWLLANHPDALPRFKGDAKNVGYLRLPTEAEWEYAARGGHAVPKASLREQDFFPMRDGTSYSEYAVFRSTDGRSSESIQAIGSRQPNPLGIFDSSGNAAEMTLDNFHFSLGGRLHGSAGGFIRKGGSFLSSLAEILPGRREEAALFIVDGPNKTRDMGARMVISGINTPSGKRPDVLDKEWKIAGSGSSTPTEHGKTPMEELDRLIANSTNPQEKDNLVRLRGIIKDNNIALERQQSAAAEELIRSSLFMVETVRNYGVRHKGLYTALLNTMEERKAVQKMSKAMRDEVENSIQLMEQNRSGMQNSLNAAVNFYRSKVEDSLNYPEKLFNDKLKLLGAELKGDDVLNRNMRRAHELYAKHISLLRQGKRSQLTRDYLIRDILPDNLREGLK